MRRRLGFVVGLVLVSFALASKPAHASCISDCWSWYRSCLNGCNGDPDCKTACQDGLEYCECGGCGYCP